MAWLQSWINQSCWCPYCSAVVVGSVSSLSSFRYSKGNPFFSQDPVVTNFPSKLFFTEWQSWIHPFELSKIIHSPFSIRTSKIWSPFLGFSSLCCELIRFCLVLWQEPLSEIPGQKNKAVANHKTKTKTNVRDPMVYFFLALKPGQITPKILGGRITSALNNPLDCWLPKKTPGNLKHTLNLYKKI